MGFLDELNEAFLKGFKQEPAPSWFGGLKIKRVASPIDPKVLAEQYERVSVVLAAWQQQLHETCSGAEQQSLIDSLSEAEAWTYFSELGVPAPRQCYLFQCWRRFVKAMAATEPVFQPLAAVEVTGLSSAERLKLHDRLVYLEKVLAEPDRILNAWSDHLFLFASSLLEKLSEELRTAPTDIDLTLSCPLIDCLPDPHQELANILRHFAGCDVVPALELGLFVSCQEKMFSAVLAFSKLKPEDLEKKEPDIPLNHQKTPAAELVPKFMGATPFRKLLMTPVPMVSSQETRFAHTHILGGSGHGKTQLLQTLVYRDLATKGPLAPSVVVIDSQGDLINTISHLALFDPNADGSLADRLLLIDPSDIEYPPAINLFDANLDRIKAYGAVEQERIFNGTIELYEYFFGALLGAGLSQKQNLIFRYLAQLMLTIPGANIHTLRELLEAPEAFTQEIAKLDGTARLFFERQFFDKSFDDTRVQVSRRLWGVLANRSFERIFSSRTSRVDLFAAMNDGKIILINTAKDLLKQEGAATFGRFFIAMIAQAALERAQVSQEKRRPTFVYIDEAQDYFDENIDHMLEQVRKYKIGLTLAHQTLAQLTPKLKASIMANTGTKLVGGMSAADAAAMAKEMGCGPEFLQSMKKTKTTTSFAVWVKGQTPRPREVTVKLGSVDGLLRMADEAYCELLARNREKYCLPVAEIDMGAEASEPLVTPAEPTAPEAPLAAPEPETPLQPKEPLYRPPVETEPNATSDKPKGQGGKRHTQIQNLIRKAGQDKGYLATIEAPTANGAGRIDVMLKREGFAIACEVSVTTKPDQEFRNIQKCLAEPVDRVALVSTSAKQLAAIQTLTSDLTVEDQAKLLFVSPQELLDVLDQRDAEASSKVTTNRGYKVSVNRFATTQDEKDECRERITSSIARGMVKER